jgi:hypothetical protein
MRREALAVALGVLAALAFGCSSADYYRLPQVGGADGSIANEVEYAYFSMAKPAYGTPYAYTEFNPAVDDQVVFYGRVRSVRRAFTLRGVLHRPDATEHASFTRQSPPGGPGPIWSIWVVETFPMTSLRAYIGRWTLTLFLDETLVGTYDFVLADKTRIDEFRRAR